MLITDETIEQYHANPALSNSKLKDFDSLGPKAYYLRYVRGGAEKKDTAAFRTGRAFETYLLEPAVFEEWFAVKPEGHDGRKGPGKDWLKEQELAGKTVIDRDDWESFEFMARAIREECQSAVELLANGIYQPTWRIDWPGVPGLQSRPDWGCEEGCARSDWKPYTLDVKTCRKLDLLISGKDIITYGYHKQAAIARLASEQGEAVHYLLAAEKEFPRRAMIIEISRTFVNIGEDWATYQLSKLADHYEADHWPLTVDDSIVVEPPTWLLRQYDEEMERATAAEAAAEPDIEDEGDGEAA